ncbi:MAG: hypothetical protein QOI50_1003, partial [Pseudonocardiales bacterium]|nr:hypothetical protein [Pseudonocardiales bacterium]
MDTAPAPASPPAEGVAEGPAAQQLTVAGAEA